MIDSRQVEEAFQSAKQELLSNPELAWIKESALRERAYFIGVCCGLQPFTAESDAGIRALLGVFGNTLFARGGDDPFLNSEANSLLEELKKLLHEEGPDVERIHRSLGQLTAHVENLDKKWSFFLREFQRVVACKRRSNSGTGVGIIPVRFGVSFIRE